MRELRKLRQLAGLTQAQVSRRTHVDRSKISLAEAGQLDLSSAEREKILRVLVTVLRKRAKQLEATLGAVHSGAAA